MAQYYKSIKEIPRDFWNSLDHDYQSTDGIYSVAQLNEESNSSITSEYMFISVNGQDFFVLINKIDIKYMESKEWFYKYVFDYFGECLLEKIIANDKDKIILIRYPLSIGADNILAVEEALKSYCNIDETTIVIHSILSNKEENNQLKKFKQKSVAYFQYQIHSSYESFLQSCPSKLRGRLKGDQRKIDQNNIIIKEITLSEEIDDIKRLNDLSRYPVMNSFIDNFSKIENVDEIVTYGFYKEDVLVQYISIITDCSISHILLNNVNEDMKQWNGALNLYTFLLRFSIENDISVAYIGAECLEAKKNRGAIISDKYLLVNKDYFD
ncbi:hypothetical protein JZO86_11895 [Enterococcus ureasiticus]|uniref:hypothetical protein n=1 Tax=Enterococcus ureasiticus TaxID=903984 RepID=UPI001A90B6CC|nr:hypothetical protein [Enterococcus ureasiticus]MBO0474401.1 hypothetical protein [Enterococcus ureasiticus]